MDLNVITYFHDIFLCSLSPEDLHDSVIQLRYVRFQDVTSITASELVVISPILCRVPCHLQSSSMEISLSILTAIFHVALA